MTLPDWARAHGPSPCAAVIRAKPEDFQVTEELGWEFSGHGEHDYLWIQKAGANTEWVARQLARFAGVPAKDVGYAGLKDRRAVTRQWFSVPRWNAPAWQSLDVQGVEVLDSERHHKKLKRGAHQANAFRIVMRGHGIARHAEALEERLKLIRAQGVPNYFGEQRFGRDGANLRLADDWAAGRRLPRHKRSIAISTARSYVFNRQLDARIRGGTWNRVLPGDVVNLDGSASVFVADDVDAELAQRCRSMDVHPAGVLWGEGAPDDASIPDSWRKALLAARVAAAYRGLRLPIRDAALQAGDDSVTLQFRLGRGAYATAVLREIVDMDDPGLSSPRPAGN